MSIESKAVAITGAGSGIGRATAIRLAQRGARIVLGARRQGRLGAFAREITAAGGEAAVRTTDVHRRGDLEALMATAVEKFGRLDVIVRHAGVGPISRFDALRVNDWDEMIDVNLRGTFYGIAAALPVFTRQASGHLVNVISKARITIVPEMGVYAATKNAVCTATEALRQGAGPTLRVTEVSPSMFSTDFIQGIAEGPTKQATRRKRTKTRSRPRRSTAEFSLRWDIRPMWMSAAS